MPNNRAIKKETSKIKFSEINLNELINFYTEELSSKKILFDTTIVKNSKLKTHSKFTDNIWAIFHDLYQGYRYLKFDKLYNFEFKNITKDEINLIKCWTAQKLLDNYIDFNEDDNSISNGRATISTVTKLGTLVDFIIASNNFSKEFLDVTKGDNIEYFFEKIEGKSSSRTKNQKIFYLFDYLDFCLVTTKVCPDIYSNRNYLEYYQRILPLYEYVNGKYIPSKKERYYLPSSNHVILFDYYLNKFFNDKDIDKTLQKYFRPLLIWWKISNIIPIRPGEFCCKIKRNCLSTKDGKYFIEINRSKKKRRKGSLPSYTYFQISEEFYDLILNYINETDKYGEVKTLISYPAIIAFDNKLKEENPLFLSKSKKYNKIYKEYYNYSQLDTLLDCFYDKIINKYFNDTLLIERLKLNNTRHFAFTSLILQGFPLVEIAMMGGHTDTQTLDEYTYNPNSYIDTQVFKTLNKTLAHYKVNESKTSNIIFSMPKECPSPVHQCTETNFFNISLGCCTTLNEYSCESYDCYNCSHWYCKPTQENFKTLCKIIQIDLDKRMDVLKSDIDFLRKLFKSTDFIHGINTDDTLLLDNDITIKMQELSNKINADTQGIINIKSKLLEGITSIDDSELKVIENLKLLNNLFNNDTKYLR